MKSLNKPAWVGDDLLSRFVNVLIQTKPIYAVMKRQARQVLIKTAEKHGVPWRQRYEELAAAVSESALAEMTNLNVTYPDYYRVPFHAYDAGNLCWDAAFEAEPATHAMALRVWQEDGLTWQAAQDRLRDRFHQVLAEQGPQQVQTILDIGCSVGISTLALQRYYQQRFPSVQTIGLDLSPYMLAVARQRDEQSEISAWMHAKGEETGLPSASCDLITLQFVIHELPQQASQAIFAEAWRLLRPQGCLAIVDNNPQSPVIQNLPPVLFTLMKSTEPWSDDYYTFDVAAAMQAVGFESVLTVATDPRHRAILGRKGKHEA